MVKFPVDPEFITLYSVYLAVALVLVAGLIQSENKRFFLWHTIFFLGYTVLVLSLFLNEENF